MEMTATTLAAPIAELARKAVAVWSLTRKGIETSPAHSAVVRIHNQWLKRIPEDPATLAMVA